MAKKLKEAVICLIHIDYSSFLFQLRDEKPDIPFPGHFGAFGGSVEGRETPKVACVRELQEELGFAPVELKFFRSYVVPDYKINLHVFYSGLTVPISDLCLAEGMDMGLFNKTEIFSRYLFSKKFLQVFPVIPNQIEFVGDFCESFPEK
jgi:8-oxo-dGTP diphosphatase